MRRTIEIIVTIIIVIGIVVGLGVLVWHECNNIGINLDIGEKTTFVGGGANV